MVPGRERQSTRVVYFPLSLSPEPLHTLAWRRQKGELNNLRNTVELMEGRYDILVQQKALKLRRNLASPIVSCAENSLHCQRN